ncbi:PAS-domain containing protein [Cognatishimia sp.]|uniref:PAS-domain containing protein n=1 Tax=Cognatishimia sp. TaxID=2211648 RepID=UPI0035174F89
MVPESVVYVAQIVMVAICATGLCLMVVRGIARHGVVRYWRAQREEAPLVMLFERGLLIDANQDALSLLGSSELTDVTWGQVRTALASRITTLPVSLGKKDPISTHPKDARLGELRATLEQWRNYARLSVYNWPTQNKRKASVRIPISEFESLTNAALDSPFPIWRLSDDNKLIWANPAFFKDYGKTIQVGDSIEQLKTQIPADLNSGQTFSTAVENPNDGGPKHFDVTMVRQGDSRTFFAVNADKVVQADDAKRSFIQTLAKTFAQLSTGLAIFDRDRRLVLFNPALMDQFGIPAGFLSGEPTLAAFFDKLRDDRMIPEPRDYGSWREKIMHMVLDATDDRYREVWPLPSGATYRVTGRPHPNGAVAFLFEDISAELSLERRFRAQLDMTKAVINNFSPAIAVISPGGTFAMTNTAFHTMWRVNPDNSITDFTWSDFEIIWKNKVKETPILAGLTNYLRLFHDRQTWVRGVHTGSGKMLHIQADPVMGGYTILTFAEIQNATTPQTEKLSTP